MTAFVHELSYESERFNQSEDVTIKRYSINKFIFRLIMFFESQYRKYQFR